MRLLNVALAGFLAAGPVGMGALTLPARAQTTTPSLSQRLNSGANAVKLSMEVACGKLEKSNCNQVLPRIAEQSMQTGLSLSPVESEGSMESASGVCAGAVPAAIVQRDAADLRRRNADCVGRYEPVGKALYPYYGYLVAAAASRYDSLSALIEDTPQGKVRNVAAGAVGSGGQVTLGYMLRTNPEWKRTVSIANYSLDTALQRITDGSVDAFFVMDGPGSDLIDQIRVAVDAKGKPLYKFLDVRPGKQFYASRDWSGRNLYQEVVLEGGFFHSTKTVSVDALMIVSNEFRENRAKNGPRAVGLLAEAIDRAQAGVFADTKTPRDWVPAAAKK
jgi:TRAP-type uncharacterized transport system substrate-binding protein